MSRRHAGIIYLFPIIIPRFTIPHGSFTITHTGCGRIHNDTDQSQEREYLVQQLNHQVLRYRRKHIEQRQ